MKLNKTESKIVEQILYQIGKFHVSKERETMLPGMLPVPYYQPVGIREFQACDSLKAKGLMIEFDGLRYIAHMGFYQAFRNEIRDARNIAEGKQWANRG